MKKGIILAACVILVSVTRCGLKSNNSTISDAKFKEVKAKDYDDNQMEIYENINNFTYQMFNQLHGENMLISPANVYCMMAILDNAVDEEYKGEFDKVLGTDDIDSLNVQLNQMINKFDRDNADIKLCNALFINDKYTLAPDADKNVIDPIKEFYGTKGETKHNFMVESGFYSYMSDDILSALSIKYRDGSVFQVVMANDDEATAGDIMSTMSEDELNSFFENSEYRIVSALKIPKFDYASDEYNLNEALNNMGITHIFKVNDAFSELGEKLSLTSISQKSRIIIDEKGTKASSSTESRIGGTIRPENEEEIEFIVNKPFVYIIRDYETNTILFMGEITNFDK